jgi:hypothetical protein
MPFEVDGITRDERRVEASGCNDDIACVVLPVVAYTAFLSDLFDTRVDRLDVVVFNRLRVLSDLGDIKIGLDSHEETDPPKGESVCTRLESPEQASSELLRQEQLSSSRSPNVHELASEGQFLSCT